MSGRNEDFWKELMGEDFKVELSPEDDLLKTTPRERPGSIIEDGFKVEYIDPKSIPTQPEPGPASKPEPEPLPASEPKPEPKADPAPAPKPVPEEPKSPQTPKPYVKKASPEPKPIRTPEPEPEETNETPQPRRLFQRKKRDPVDDFEVEFDFDEAYADVEEKVVRRGRTKRTGCLSGILVFLFVICVSFVLASLGWMWATDVLGLDGDDEKVEVTLPESIFHEEEREEEQENEDGEIETVTVTVQAADIDAVAEELYSKGLIRYPWLFKLFCSFAHADTKVKAGTYTLSMNYDYRALIHGMNPSGGQRATVKLTIPEGYTITQIVALMVENNVCGEEELLDALANYDFDYDFLDSSTLGEPKRLEGYLFPDTYEFYVNDSPESVIKRFLNNFGNKWTQDLQAMADEIGYSMEEVLIIASMIEKEAGADSERDSIASVIYNRLNHPDRQGTNGYLQIDATIHYIIADTGEEFSTEIDSPYNTYLYPGLPVGPIANPGIASIRAALDPASTNYYFYALSTTGTHRFFETYDAFAAFVASDEYGG